MNKHRHGFTLAEVLITLVIIGIIAAMTIPTLMNNTNDQELVVATKKAYSVLSQANTRMISNYGDTTLRNKYGSRDSLNPQKATKELGDMLVKYFTVQKNCGSHGRNGECWASKHRFAPESSGYQRYNDFGYTVRLNDGTSLSINDAFSIPYDDSYSGFDSKLGYPYAVVYVDVNGDKAPNIAGIDTFGFYLTSERGVIPMGTKDDLYAPFSQCLITDGAACTAWVIMKGNMDYKKSGVEFDDEEQEEALDAGELW